MSDAAATTPTVQQPPPGRTEVVIQRERDDRQSELPKWRVKEIEEASAAHKAEAARLKTELEAERTKSARGAELEAEAARYRLLHQTDTAMLVLAREHEALADEDVRDLFRETHAKQAARMGDKAPSFGDWLTAQREAPSPLLRPYLGKAAAEEAGAAKPPPKTQAKPPLNVDGGATTSATQARARLSDAEIARIIRVEPMGSDLMKQAEAQMRADGQIR